MISQWKRSTRKRHTSFLLFHFWDLKLVTIDSALNSVSGKRTNFFKNVVVVPRKAAKLQNPAKILQKVIVFFLERVEEIEPWFWHIWIVQWLIFFPTTDYILLILAIFRGNGWSKLDQKCKLWVCLSFMKPQILQIFFKQCYCLLEY